MQQPEEASGMESLPTELLVTVLSLAASGPDRTLLLEVAPLVCRRWRDAARDPRCWAYVDAVVKPTSHIYPSDMDLFGYRYFFKRHVTKDHLLLARAHAIRNLALVEVEWPRGYAPRKTQPHFIDDALQASRAVALQVSVTMPVWYKMSNEGRSGFLGLLWRSRKVLRSLEACVDFSAVQQRGRYSKRPKQAKPPLRLHLLEVLARLRRLHTLRLDVDCSDLKYGGELAAMSAPCLRLLRVATSRRDSSAYPVALLEDLLRAGAATLEDVAVSGWWPLPESTLRLLAACPKLARLAAAPACLANASGGLDAVKELVLDVCVQVEDESSFSDSEDEDRPDPADAADGKALRMVEEAVNLCCKGQPSLRSLESLAVHLSLRSLWDKPREWSKTDQCRALLGKVSSRRPSVAVELIVNEKLELRYPDPAEGEKE